MESIYSVIPEIIQEIRDSYSDSDGQIIVNKIIREDIFKILEQRCIVIYYPIEEEIKNRGFHIKRFVNGELRDFVYINTARPLPDQVFAAAHELGHVWRVADMAAAKLNASETITGGEEENFVNRFAAELLMPEDEFVKTFFLHIREMKFDPKRIRTPELIKIMVMQMADYMVPYEAVRRRLVEVNLLAENVSIFLDQKNKGIDQLISTFIKEQNTMLDNSTKKKTIPGLRNLIEEVERKGTGGEYIIGKIKDDFSISRVSDAENIFNINAGE